MQPVVSMSKSSCSTISWVELLPGSVNSVSWKPKVESMSFRSMLSSVPHETVTNAPTAIATSVSLLKSVFSFIVKKSVFGN